MRKRTTGGRHEGTGSFFSFSEKVQIILKAEGEPCYDYAASELARLFGRIGVKSSPVRSLPKNAGWRILVRSGGIDGVSAAKASAQFKFDGYAITVKKNSVEISAASSKGVLNGVYGLARRLGFMFLYPGQDGERAPAAPKEGGIRLRAGRSVMEPRFKWRGVFFGGLTHDHSLDEWLVFYAKLGFNAVCVHSNDEASNAKKLGLRMEKGGHGYRDLLPRGLFKDKPELFRMHQPEDFGGKRVEDFNSCAAHPEARREIRSNFVRKVADAGDFHAVHLWPDDLPGGGWCLCPLCRSLSPSDQALVAMRNLSRAVREAKLSLRVPMIAYHDTITPANNFRPTKEMFLLYAPRERCYAHRLDDPACERNKFYLDSLKGWVRQFKGIDDSHTFEYYFDQILFRGLHPFLPDVILGDMLVYERAGIESHMSLQVGGPCVAPEWNMLIFADAMWKAGPQDAGSSIDDLTAAMPPAEARAWRSYLKRRAAVFADAMRMCEYDPTIYMDYRWLPEHAGKFAKEMSRSLRSSSRGLSGAAAALAAAAAKWPEASKALAAKEAARARFEAVELRVMSCQQLAVHMFAKHLQTESRVDLEEALKSCQDALDCMAEAKAAAEKAGIPAKAWYFKCINQWLSKETAAKAAAWRKELA